MNERIDETIRASSVARILRWAVFFAKGPWLRALAGAVCIAMVLSVTASLGTESLPFWLRTVYWLFEMLTGAGIIGVVLWLIRGVDRRRLILRIALVAGLAIPAITVAVWATTEPIKGRALRWERTMSYLPGVLPVAAFNAFMQFLVGRKELAGMAFANPPPPAGPLVGNEPLIYAIEASAHYVLFHTSAGQIKKLMRLYDAIASADRTTEGLQIHRSWWIALSAVERFDERNRKLVLKTGIVAPVSRDNLKAVRKALEKLD